MFKAKFDSARLIQKVHIAQETNTIKHGWSSIWKSIAGYALVILSHYSDYVYLVFISLTC